MSFKDKIPHLRTFEKFNFLKNRSKFEDCPHDSRTSGYPAHVQNLEPSIFGGIDL